MKFHPSDEVPSLDFRIGSKSFLFADRKQGPLCQSERRLGSQKRDVVRQSRGATPSRYGFNEGCVCSCVDVLGDFTLNNLTIVFLSLIF